MQVCQPSLYQQLTSAAEAGPLVPSAAPNTVKANNMPGRFIVLSFSTLPFAGGARTFRAPGPLNALLRRVFHGLIPSSSRPIPSHDAKVLAVDLLESNRHKPS